MATVNVRDTQQAAGAGNMSKFIKNLAKTDKALYDLLVELMKFFNMIDVDLRLVSQLKASFISKE